MVTKTYIAENLQSIALLFNASSSPRESLFYSKLAIIELCGWIQMSMDDIVLRLSSRRLKEQHNQKYIKDNIVRRTYGFDYDRHFLPMIEAIIGRYGIEQMSAKIDKGILQALIGALSTLKRSRDQLAHQYIKGTTLTIDAPSATIARLPIVLAGLKNIEAVLRKS